MARKVYTYQDNSLRPNSRETVKNASSPEQSLYTVGQNGDFSTLNAALDHLSQFELSNSDIEVRMLSGFVVEETLTLTKKDFRFVTLTSEDVEVPISTEYMFTLPGSQYFLQASNTVCPNIGTMFAFDTDFDLPTVSGTDRQKGGIFIANSQLQIDSSNLHNGKFCGIKNAPTYGIIASTNSNLLLDFNSRVINCGRIVDQLSGGPLDWATNVAGITSRIIMSGALVTGSNRNGVLLLAGSYLYAQQTNGQECAHRGLYVEASHANVRFSAFRLTPGEDSINDIELTAGSILQASGSSIGGANINPNEFTSNGIIIRA